MNENDAFQEGNGSDPDERAGDGEATAKPQWYGAIRALYQELDDEIDRSASSVLSEMANEGRTQSSLCLLRGVCCDFRVADHRLYATGVEVAYALETRDVAAPEVGDDTTLCPFWADGLCTARHERPVGCRTYFCDPRWQETGHALHEEYHRRVKEIGESAGFAYEYGSFVAMARASTDGPSRAPLDR